MTYNEFHDAAELKQRIRRVLSVLRSMAAHMGAHCKDPEESVLHLSGRIGAIARALLAPVSYDGMDLESLVLDELLAHAAQRERCFISGSGVRLDAKSAELMSLVIHELATNSVKYGALSQSRAQITVIWALIECLGSRRLHFEWLEEGVRMIAGAPHTPGFGSELIERVIASELHGEGKMAFLPEGVRCTIEIPFTRGAESA
jgi:two-component system, chemotaxis family, CheB/CheR fusion protein